MKSIFLLGILFATLLFFGFPQNSYSAGTKNDVLVRKDGDILYLTTTATNAAEKNSTHSASTTSTASAQLLQDTDIFIPTGFATNIGSLLNALLSAVMLIGALLVFLQLILAGFYWITSGGDKGKTDAARQRLIAAIIGLIILASSFAILTLSLNFLGFDSLQDVLESTKTIS